ncbi:hypothetical protein CTP10_R64750 (plasmid) [Cupriavidus sp. P-10]|nr:hypothetical protein CTP10_R64750 [Cupriavidus sp. P-10]
MESGAHVDTVQAELGDRNAEGQSWDGQGEMPA